MLNHSQSTSTCSLIRICLPFVSGGLLSSNTSVTEGWATVDSTTEVVWRSWGVDRRNGLDSIDHMFEYMYNDRSCTEPRGPPRTISTNRRVPV